VRRSDDRRSARRLGRVLVRGRSMEPTLLDGDQLLVLWGGVPRPGRLVVVRWPDRPLSVKRAALRADGGWWVERDNPAEGVDSWQVGAVAPDDVLGVVLLRLWPLRRR
jgi:phage repressor protein C with HTH and peptisase S24 domain